MVVDPNRVRAVQSLLAQNNCDVVISDDGLQHYALGRDIEIIVVSAKRGLGNGFRLPVGPLRESVARLKQADFVLGNDIVASHGVQLTPTAWVHTAADRKRVDPRYFAGKSAHCIAGIAYPEGFFELCEDLGVQVIRYPLPDHAEDYEDVLSRVDREQSDLVLLTEKDAVKTPDGAGLDIWYLEVVAQLEESFTALLASRLEAASKG